MARLEEMPEPTYTYLAEVDCPEFPETPWTTGPALSKRRIALVSTAGLHLRGDPPFEGFAGEYRVIPGDAGAADVIMSHVSTNFDRTGFFQDWNQVFPLDRLRELAAAGTIGSTAAYHYSFMGAVDPRQMEDRAREAAGLLKRDGVDGVLLAPV